MSINIAPTTKGPLVLVTEQSGVTVIPQPTPLTRLNYFDGKFLRASDLSAEQLYLRRLVDISNQAGGGGVVYGYDICLGESGDRLNLGPGLAIDPQGRVLLLPQAFAVDVQELIEKSRQVKILPSAPIDKTGFTDCSVAAATQPDGVAEAGAVYLITIGSAEALCGTEEVFGRLCEEACATTSDRPYLVEGVILRAIPLQLQTPLPTSAVIALSQLHLRSRIAAAYFEDERKKVASFISGEGLRSEVWCFGAQATTGLSVPIGVIARTGATTLFLDAWIARRERIDAPPKRYWQQRMAMRPWDVFLAQILQFQCQLRDLFRTAPPVGGGDDPCAKERTLVREASDVMAKIATFYEVVTERLASVAVSADAAAAPPEFEGGLQALVDLQKRLAAVGSASAVTGDKILIDGGIIELPSAGYLPVAPSSVLSVNEQVRRWLGRGVDLRFCIVRPDFVAHALEEAQHMERIPLMQGLDDPTKKPKVDILVPNGEIIEQRQLSPGRGFEAMVGLNTALFAAATAASERPALFESRTLTIPHAMIQLYGAARTDMLPSGGGAAYLAAELVVADRLIRTLPGFDAAAQKEAAGGNARAGAWTSLFCERNVFNLKRGDVTNINARGIVAVTTVANVPVLDIELNGVLEIIEETVTVGTVQSLKGRIENAQLSLLGESFGNPGPRKAILVNLDVVITLTGGSVIEIILSQQQFRLKLSGGWGKQPLEVNAAIAIETLSHAAEGSPTEVVLATGALKENADVLSAANTSHKQALDALDLVGAALRDVNFVAAKARLLFPPPPPLTDDLVVRSTLDWALFHRRRDKQCGALGVVAQVKPPQTYRVFNITAPTVEVAQESADKLAIPTRLAKYIREESRTSPSLVIKYAGDSTQPLFDFGVADSQWKLFKPGRSIAFVFYGAKDNDNEVLQTNRLRQFESAIGDDSKENESTTLKPLVPLPKDASPPDADGVMLFITVAELRKALLVYGYMKEGTFVTRDEIHRPIEFHGNSPQGSVLKDYIDSLGSRPVVGVTLGTIDAEPDPGAAVRLKAVIDALARRPAPVRLGQAVRPLSSDDRKEVGEKIGEDHPDRFDEIFFFEFDDDA